MTTAGQVHHPHVHEHYIRASTDGMKLFVLIADRMIELADVDAEGERSTDINKLIRLSSLQRGVIRATLDEARRLLDLADDVDETIVTRTADGDVHVSP